MNRIKIFLLSSLICFTIASFAQSNEKYTPLQQGEYLLKILMHEMTLDNEKIGTMRQSIYSSAQQEQEIFDLFGDRPTEEAAADIKRLRTERDKEIRSILTEDEYPRYEEIVGNLNAEISSLLKSK